MSREFQPGDFLIFQLEAGFGLLRLLAVTEAEGREVWHLAAYNDLFLDVESAEAALAEPWKLSVSNPHMALTKRAFESTQVAALLNIQLDAGELEGYQNWLNEGQADVSDRSVRLMLGLR